MSKCKLTTFISYNKLPETKQLFPTTYQYVSVKDTYIINTDCFILSFSFYLTSDFYRVKTSWKHKRGFHFLGESQTYYLHVILTKQAFCTVHICVSMCTRVDVADSLAPSYWQCKGERDWNADALFSSTVIKRKAENNRSILASTWHEQEDKETLSNGV